MDIGDNVWYLLATIIIIAAQLTPKKKKHKPQSISTT